MNNNVNNTKASRFSRKGIITIVSVTLLLVAIIIFGLRQPTANNSENTTNKQPANQQSNQTNPSAATPQNNSAANQNTPGTANTPNNPSPTPATATPNPDNATTININSNAFSPANLTVKKGAAITWLNKDTTTHAIDSADTSQSGPHSPQLKPGESFTYSFAKAGTYKYICVIHPQMSGTVIVTD